MHVSRSVSDNAPLIARRWRDEKPYLTAVFAAAFFLYALTTPRLVALEDDALFIGALHFWGVAHPPGYPAHTFFGGIFYRLLPFLSPAHKAHLFSGFAAAAACAAVYGVTAMLVRERPLALLAAAAFAASKTFWSQAIVSETYTLNALLFFLTLALCLIARQRHDNRSLIAAAAVYGVGLANHYPLLMLATPGLAALVLPLLWRRPRHFIVLPLVSALTAAPFYLWMVWRSHQDIDYNFYGAINDWEQFWFYLSRSGYAAIDQQAGVNWSDKAAYLKFLSAEMLRQFTPAGFVLAAVGFVSMLRSQRLVGLALSLSFFCSSFLLVYALDFNNTFINTAIFRVYPIIAYGVMAIWLARGAAAVVSPLSGAARRRAAGVVLAVVTAAVVAAHWEENNRRNYRWAHDFALAKLQSVEFGSAVFLDDDLDLPAGYLHYVEGTRADLAVHHNYGLIYRNRLFPVMTPEYAPADNPQAPNIAAILQNFTHNNRHRRIYYHPQLRALFYSPSDFTGFFNRLSGEPENRLVISRDALRWLTKAVAADDDSLDPWSRLQMRTFVLQLMIALDEHEDKMRQAVPEWGDITARARKKYPAAQVMHLSRTMHQMNDRQRIRAKMWADSFNIKDAVFFDKAEKSDFYLLRARLARLAGDDENYTANLQTALEQLSTSGNPALQPLLAHYFHRRRYCELYDTATSYYPQLQEMPPRARHFLAVAGKHCFTARKRG